MPKEPTIAIESTVADPWKVEPVTNRPIENYVIAHTFGSVEIFVFVYFASDCVDNITERIELDLPSIHILKRKLGRIRIEHRNI